MCFLHAADIHLDSPLPGLDDMKRTRSSAARKVFAGLIQSALESAKASQLDRTCPSIGILQLRSMIVG